MGFEAENFYKLAATPVAQPTVSKQKDDIGRTALPSSFKRTSYDNICVPDWETACCHHAVTVIAGPETLQDNLHN